VRDASVNSGAASRAPADSGGSSSSRPAAGGKAGFAFHSVQRRLLARWATSCQSCPPKRRIRQPRAAIGRLQGDSLSPSRRAPPANPPRIWCLSKRMWYPSRTSRCRRRGRSRTMRPINKGRRRGVPRQGASAAERAPRRRFSPRATDGRRSRRLAERSAAGPWGARRGCRGANGADIAAVAYGAASKPPSGSPSPYEPTCREPGPSRRKARTSRSSRDQPCGARDQGAAPRGLGSASRAAGGPPPMQPGPAEQAAVQSRKKTAAHVAGHAEHPRRGRPAPCRGWARIGGE